MNQVYLITGGNVGNRNKHLQQAAEKIEKTIGNILTSSSIYETAAWGNTDQPSFYNQVHLVETDLTPNELIGTILNIEKEMGRIRTIKNAARIIDIDILFYQNTVIELPDLVIPHKEIANRQFVLKPLLEINPDFIHPKLKKTIRELANECEDNLEVVKLESTHT